MAITVLSSAAAARLCFPVSDNHQFPKKLSYTKSAISIPRRSTISFHIRASNSPRQEENSRSNNSTDFASQEDLKFLLKLGAGSVAGAAVIKYGSVILPQITRPNIIEALIMVSTPVIVAVVLLIKQSRAEG
ncbi:hypothetical protein HS088_TW12G00276 [Tripterygium wilfordii]|uniref:Uncharacterized protein n=1 Tax=Tripterygium wilfordii TaxID=458696 RepID=A0A7J7CYJ1_TRIWF|nr:uncharacterized protein LOC120010949 [Tripterygium wilfordii]KAF5739078.1 hypothetical protein HS088_TW12G00276 [Tripterygium wilfordii]